MASSLLGAVLELTKRLPGALVEDIAGQVAAAGSPGGRIDLGSVAHPEFRRNVELLLTAWAAAPSFNGREVAAMLRAAAAARTAESKDGVVEVVMTGPSRPDAPTRSTEAVVSEIVAGARRELMMVTYAAAPYPPLRAALELAAARGVRTTIAVETVEGARGFLNFEPALAFAGVAGVQLLHWPTEERIAFSGGRLHAKLVVADREVAFVTSANLTGSALGQNIECGLVVRGGSAPRRLADHFAALAREGVLRPLTGGLVRGLDAH